jgi:adenosine kinase
MTSILVTGSIAYDYVMRIDDEFKNIILPDQLDKLNIGLVATDMQKSLGGTAANISYSLGLLGYKDRTHMLGTVGHDFQIDERLSQYIDFSHIDKIDNDFTACAYVITDRQQNQIIPFYAGAMSKAYMQSLDLFTDVDYCIVSPNNKDAMMKFLQEAHQKYIKTFFDPGQQLGMFSREELLQACSLADYLVCNGYEFELLMNKTELTKEQLLNSFEYTIITKGKDGAYLYEVTEEIHVPGFSVTEPVDPTGCGDGFRAGLLYGLINEKTWEESVKIGNAVASFVVRSQGTMNHYFTLEQIEDLSI